MPFPNIQLIILGLVSFSISVLSLYFLIPFLTKKAFLDIPNARSSHKKVTPRGGGLGILLGILAGAIVALTLDLPLPHVTFFIGFAMMAVISFLDDKKSLPVGIRLAVHLGAMALVLYQTGGLRTLPFPAPLNIELGLAGYMVSAIWIVAAINFYNFLDGIDGYAGSQALVASIGLILIQNGAINTVAFCIAFSSLGFLLYNWHPAKIFMGDVGSVSLGFAFATLPFYSEYTASEELVFSVALFLWFFLADGAFTLIKRLLNKEKIWEPHRTHLYQRLSQTGWPHHHVALLFMSFAAIVVAIQVYFSLKNHPMQWLSVAIALGLFLLFIVLVRTREQRPR